MANVKKFTLDWNTTGLTIYGIIRREADSFRLNSADGTFATNPASPYLSLTEDTVIKGRYELSESRTVWNDGRYTFAIYKQVGGSPAPVSDMIIGTGEMDIVGDLEIYPDVFSSAIKTKTDFLPAATAGAAGGVFIAGTNAATSVTTALTANITGNVSGSVNSVATDVGITQVGADKVWSSATRTLTAFSTTLALSVWDVLESAIVAASSIGVKVKKLTFDTSNSVQASYVAATGIVVTDASNNGGQFKTDLTNSNNDAYLGGFLRFTSGVLAGLPPKRISSSNGATKFVYLSSSYYITPTAGDAFKIVIE